MKYKLTEAEKKALKERKRVCKIQGQICRQSATIKFHELYEIEGDNDVTKTKEVKAAKLKIAELRSQI